MNIKPGTWNFHEEPNMNYTLNRIFSVNGGTLDEIKQAAEKIHSIEDWTKTFRELSEKAGKESRWVEEAAYLRAVNFYYPIGTEEKFRTWKSYVEKMTELYKNSFLDGSIERIEVPYREGFLPVWRVIPETRKKKQTAVMHLGYDSLKEEMLPLLKLFSEEGVELYLFEGPGQGEALYRYGLTMTHKWEEPVSAVLDFCHLSDITLIGLSLGAFLAPRAAAFETRISRVICWGVLYDFLETVISRRGKGFEAVIKFLLGFRLKGVLNLICRLKMKKDSYARWGIEQGMHIYGVNTPYHYFQELKNYRLSPIADKVWQDILLLGNREDHFIPETHFGKTADALVNARSFSGRIFSRDEGAENHVGFGNVPFVVKTMLRWMEDIKG